MISPRSFQLSVDADGVAVVTLADPPTLNALTFESYRELGEFARAAALAPQVRAVVVTGAGTAFCSGGNLRTIIAALLDASDDERRSFNRLTAESVRAMLALPKPVVAAVNGVAFGGGAALALAADLRLACPDARFGFGFSQVGLSAADMGVTWLLPRLVGLGRAMELLSVRPVITAPEAFQWGLINRLETRETLLPRAVELAARMADGPALAFVATKRLLQENATVAWEEALEREIDAQTDCMSHADFREGYQAFIGKRPPRFKRP